MHRGHGGHGAGHAGDATRIHQHRQEGEAS
jgi:hypothetical protein